MKNLVRIAMILFISISGIAQNWVQQGQDIIGENSGDSFGAPIALNNNGGRVAVSGINNGNFKGHLRIYENQSGSWVQLGQDIDGNNASDQLGISIEINAEGNRVITSSKFQFTDSSGVVWGDARVFEFQSDNWVPMGDFITGPPNQAEPFAYAVSMNASGTIVAASSRAWQGFSGLTRVYEFIGGVWTQLGNDIVGNPGEVAAAEIALNAAGNRIAIGAPGYDEGGVDNLGIVRVFELVGGTWTQLGQGITGEGAFDEIGEAFELNDSGDRIIIGEPFNDGIAPGAGQARVFEMQSGNWVQLGSTFSGTQEADNLGWDVSINSQGDRIAFAKVLDNLSNNKAGIVAVYEYSNGNWQQLFQELEGVNVGDGYGVQVSISGEGEHVATGAIAIGPGVAYVYVNDEILSTNNTMIGINAFIYPNPNEGRFLIDLEMEYSDLIVEIFGPQGRLISTENYEKTKKVQIEESLPSGVYFIRLTNEAGLQETLKIVVF